MMVFSLPFCSRERNAKEYVLTEFPDYEHWPCKLFAFAILFETYIGSNSAPPNLAFIEVDTDIVFVVLFLVLIPFIKIFIHTI